MLGKLLNFIEKIDTRPIKVKEKCCTKIISSKSNCSACQDVCSQNAIIIDDEEIRIDFDKCNQCGLCVTSCPNQVFNLEIDSDSHLLNEVQKKLNVSSNLIIQCQAAKKNKNSIQIKCLGRLSERLLLKLLFTGADSIWLQSGQCAQCQLQSGRKLIDRAVNNCNFLLKNYFDESRIIISMEEPNNLNFESFNLKETNYEGKEAEGLGRREFINKLRDESINGLTSLLTFSQNEKTEKDSVEVKINDKRKELLSLIERLEDNVTKNKRVESLSLFWKVDIGIDCDFCQICTSLCPNNVLELKNEKEEKKIVANHNLCTNCGLCEDVCYKQQISINQDINYNLDNSEQEVIVGLKKVCNECQKEFYTAKQDKKICSFCESSKGIL
ncbi:MULTISPECIES: 4Fe-4S dicluster domain-containing protein [unclassified Candidatus Frackibacter]|uniref:4Fe-4S dicluster domain-containing protein n=1 Tax=unclassified Candidatus Frackibacter TaxID=2648818 RepID=UPI000891D1BA|nr:MULTISPECIES: ferredoxin family protein [unclassified Candidatus Frackibacter]SDC47058.1 Methyl-viologen-reducing hydrogenase, delta subunit [Candidatus Frackibacter sp. WG11]SEM81546.1 Methyl-viologen-reducing hydrogenase, delta subunit [Candidatus Frackibacter sp. WG12]SFL72471.1 Methyl-viologen-reducing hydrogenase, delta subunit [Candidatus Frackibacter sp. WG13]